MADIETAADRGRGRSTCRSNAFARCIPLTDCVNPRCPPWRRSEIRAALEACRAPGESCRVTRIHPALAELLLLLALTAWLRLASGLG